MRIVVLANNWIGWKVAEKLVEGDDDVVGLVVHPPERRACGDEIIETVGLAREHVFDGSRIRDEVVRTQLADLKADIAVSALFGYILPKSVIDLFPEGVINVHPALLPYNRGAYPNVWSIVDRTPAGSTIHYIDEGIDTGPVIAQKRVEVEPVDTGKTLYRKLEHASVELFAETWPRIRERSVAPTNQESNGGTYHRTNDVENIDEIDLDRSYKARDLIDVLRARTFPPHGGAYFRAGDRKIYMELHLSYGSDREPVDSDD